jgi:hypothetical protein
VFRDKKKDRVDVNVFLSFSLSRPTEGSAFLQVSQPCTLDLIFSFKIHSKQKRARYINNDEHYPNLGKDFKKINRVA